MLANSNDMVKQYLTPYVRNKFDTVPTPKKLKTIFNPKYDGVTMNMFSKSRPITGMSGCRVFKQKFRYGVGGRGRWWPLNIFMIVDIHDMVSDFAAK